LVWGPGEILEVYPDGKLIVYFALVGAKTLKGVSLTVVTGEDAWHPLLEYRIRSHKRGSKTRSIAELKAAFLRLYPKGFSDPKYLYEERDYKVDASRHLQTLLNRSIASGLIEDGKYDEFCKIASSIVNETNLIFPNEKMDLRDGLKEEGANRKFAVSLFDLLYGDDSFESRFEAFSQTLFEMNAPKWTTATYFPFLAFPEEHMFLKPVVTQKAAEACDFELNYRSELNWLTYSSLLRFASCIREVVADLNPRDMIDLQSFIWVIGLPNVAGV